MSNPVSERGNFTNFTATTSITQAKGIIGLLTATTASGTVTITDTAGNAITGTLTPSAGSYIPIPANCTGLTLTVANTINCTVFWE